MGYTQPGGCTKVLTFCRLEINFPIFFPAIFYWAERIKNGELGINRPTWCCSLFPIPTVKDSRKGFLDPFHHYVLSIQRIHRIIFFLLFNGRRCSADDYIGAREKKKIQRSQRRRRRKVPNQKPIDPNVSVSGRAIPLCWERLYTSNRSLQLALLLIRPSASSSSIPISVCCYSFTAPRAPE
jgi:hypothetical protein